MSVPHPHVSIYSAEIFSIKHNMVPKRQKSNFKGHSFWARGYYVSTVGLDEAKIGKYIQDQEVNETVEDKYDSDPSKTPLRGASKTMPLRN